jgi:hypothetical protein
MLLSVLTRAEVLAAMAPPGEELVTSLICSLEEWRTKIENRGAVDVRVLMA